MRKVIVRVAVAVLALLAFSSPARADLIPIGQLQWLDLGNGGQFSIINQTGVNHTDDFPVVTALTFNAINLDITKSDSSHEVLGLAGFTDNGLTLDSNNSYVGPLLAELTGSVIPTGLVTLDGGATNPGVTGSWFILTGILSPVPVVVNPTRSIFETAIIYVDAQRSVPVPEPVTLTLLGLGAAGLIVRRRMAAARG